MNANDILDIIGETEDKHVRDAHEGKSSRRGRRIVNIAIGAAACVVLVPMVIFGGLMLFMGGMGAASAAPSAGAPNGSDGDGTYGGYVYMSYAGPVLPLSTLESSEGVSAERNLDISFAAYGAENGKSEALITDSYILTNSTEADITLNAVYPYVASYYECAEEGLVPELRIDGAMRSVTEGELVYGPYSGTFVPVYGADLITEENDGHNLSDLSSFSGYEALLSDGSYLAAAFGEAPALDMSVTVYRLSDYEFTSDTSATNPTLNMAFEMDSEKTAVLTWNFNGGSNNVEEGKYERHSGGIEIHPNASPENQYPDDAYLIFVGEDIEGYTIQGYKNGGCKANEKLDDLGCRVTRYESTMGEVLRQLIYESFGAGEAEVLYALTAENLVTVGPLGEDGVSRYSEGMLDSLVYDVRVQSRITYLAFPVTVPALGSVSVELSLPKEASHDYYGEGSEKGLNGYEFATVLGSSLEFTRQSASISDSDGIEIVSSNFGFDLENGVTSVELDMSVSNYWLDIREKRAEE